MSLSDLLEDLGLAVDDGLHLALADRGICGANDLLAQNLEALRDAGVLPQRHCRRLSSYAKRYGRAYPPPSNVRRRSRGSSGSRRQSRNSAATAATATTAAGNMASGVSAASSKTAVQQQPAHMLSAGSMQLSPDSDHWASERERDSPKRGAVPSPPRITLTNATPDNTQPLGQLIGPKAFLSAASAPPSQVPSAASRQQSKPAVSAPSSPSAQKSSGAPPASSEAAKSGSPASVMSVNIVHASSQAKSAAQFPSTWSLHAASEQPERSARTLSPQGQQQVSGRTLTPPPKAYLRPTSTVHSELAKDDDAWSADDDDAGLAAAAAAASRGRAPFSEIPVEYSVVYDGPGHPMNVLSDKSGTGPVTAAPPMPTSLVPIAGGSRDERLEQVLRENEQLKGDVSKLQAWAAEVEKKLAVGASGSSGPTPAGLDAATSTYLAEMTRSERNSALVRRPLSPPRDDAPPAVVDPRHVSPWRLRDPARTPTLLYHQAREAAWGASPARGGGVRGRVMRALDPVVPLAEPTPAALSGMHNELLSSTREYLASTSATLESIRGRTAGAAPAPVTPRAVRLAEEEAVHARLGQAYEPHLAQLHELKTSLAALAPEAAPPTPVTPAAALHHASTLGPIAAELCSLRRGLRGCSPPADAATAVTAAQLAGLRAGVDALSWELEEKARVAMEAPGANPDVTDAVAGQLYDAAGLRETLHELEAKAGGGGRVEQRWAEELAAHSEQVRRREANEVRLKAMGLRLMAQREEVADLRSRVVSEEHTQQQQAAAPPPLPLSTVSPPLRTSYLRDPIPSHPPQSQQRLLSLAAPHTSLPAHASLPASHVSIAAPAGDAALAPSVQVPPMHSHAEVASLSSLRTAAPTATPGQTGAIPPPPHPTLTNTGLSQSTAAAPLEQHSIAEAKEVPPHPQRSAVTAAHVTSLDLTGRSYVSQLSSAPHLQRPEYDHPPKSAAPGPPPSVPFASHAPKSSVVPTPPQRASCGALSVVAPMSRTSYLRTSPSHITPTHLSSRPEYETSHALLRMQSRASAASGVPQSSYLSALR